MEESLRLSATTQIKAPAPVVWRYLADTDRMNRAIGLPPVRFSSSPDPGAAKQYRAEATLLGINLRYEEHPFEWVAGRYYQVRRTFPDGPLREYTGGLRLIPRAEGVSVESFAEIAPRSWLGVALARVVGRRIVERQIPRFVSRFDTGRPPPPAPNHAELATALVDDGVEVDLARALVRHAFRAAPVEAACLRPFELARQWDRGREEVLHAMALGAREGLFDPRWLVFCPSCLSVHDRYATLRLLPDSLVCRSCGLSSRVMHSSSVELRFAVARAHRPELEKTYCIGGPMNFPSVVAQLIVRPGEARTEEIALKLGRYRVFCFQFGRPATIEVSPVGGETEVSFSVSSKTCPIHAGSLKAGPIRFNLVNYDSREALFVVERDDWQAHTATASDVLALPELRILLLS